jgi:beta-lactamase class A
VLEWHGDPRVTWSVQVTDADTDEVLLAHTPEVVLPTASVAKVLLLLEVAARIDDGRLDPRKPLSRAVTERVGDSGLWHRMVADELPVGDVALLVGSVSDNWATNVLALEVGLERSGLLDLVRDVRGPDDPPTLSIGNASAWTTLLGRLHRDELPGGDIALGWLSSGVDHSLVLSAYAHDPLVVDDALVNKTGADAGVRADVGLVPYGAWRVAYAAIAAYDEPQLEHAAITGLRALGAALRQPSSAARRFLS